MELPEAARSMVEHTIQKNTNILLVRFIEQFVKRVIPAQQGVDVVIIIGVVTMIGSRGKDRVEIKSRDPQVLQIIQFFGDPV